MNEMPLNEKTASIEEQFVDELETVVGSDVLNAVDDLADLSEKDRAVAKLASLTDEQQERVAEIINKYREKMLKEKLKEMQKLSRPKSFYTKKGPGKGKKARKR